VGRNPSASDALNGDPQLRNSVLVQSNAAKGALYASMAVFGGATAPTVQLLGGDSIPRGATLALAHAAIPGDTLVW
jgi:hypothetical protein